MAAKRVPFENRRSFLRFASAIGVVLLAVILSGCPATLGGGAGDVQFTVLGEAYRTVNADVGACKEAAAKALKALGMEPSGAVTTEKGAKIVAATSKLNIRVELERITSRATKIFVDVKVGTLQKDRATAAEILRRTVANLRQSD